jgi:hypothetical protein
MIMDAWQQFLGELGESAILGCFEPGPVKFTREHEDDVPRVRAAMQRAVRGNLARFRFPVNRSGFLLGCLDYTETSVEEHLVVGYGYRRGSTTEIGTLHHVTGGGDSVAITPTVLHMMREHYGGDKANEVIVFHNHPINPLNLLFDNLPLASRTDRLTLERLTFNRHQFLRSLLGDGRVFFYLAENGFVKQFGLPSLL